ncbi:hypothetical protein NUACC21_51050 [Scytonema sp. NUACC21]
MLRNKLHTYIASTLLANVLIATGLLPPAYATSTQTAESGNYEEKLALNPSRKTNVNGTLRQGNDTKIDAEQSNEGEVISCPFTSNAQDLRTSTTTNTDLQSLIQYFDSQFIENEIGISGGIELNLDSILADEYDREGVLLARCCL